MGNLFVVGIGPGDLRYMTEEAKAALTRSDLIVGYPAYLELVSDLIRDKETYATPMRGEIERCKKALEEAQEGKTVSIVCSGDAGVYGMASPVLELSPSYENVEISVVPGVTAALSGAAVLGAPLGNDFCVLSLSDLLTPWEWIEKRLRAAAMGDFNIAIYNPSSRKRKDHLSRACTILTEAGKPADTPCGIVRNIGRDGETYELMTLAQLKDTPVDMFTTVFIGSRATRVIDDKLVTLRGYRYE